MVLDRFAVRILFVLEAVAEVKPSEDVQWLLSTGGELNCDNTCRLENLACVEDCWPRTEEEFKQVTEVARKAQNGGVIRCVTITVGGAWYDPSAALQFDDSIGTRSEHASCGWSSDTADWRPRCSRDAGINSYRFCPCAADVAAARCRERQPVHRNSGFFPTPSPTSPQAAADSRTDGTSLSPLHAAPEMVSDSRVKPRPPAKTLAQRSPEAPPAQEPGRAPQLAREGQARQAVSSTGARAESSSAMICKWVSVALGTLLGLAFAILAGPGKLLQEHPIHYLMHYGFENLYGPYFGLPARPFMLFVGFADLLFGVGVLVGLWTTALEAVVGDTKDLAKSLLLCAFEGNLVMDVAATAFHMQVEGSTGPTAIIAVLSCMCLACRFVVSPLQSLSPAHASLFWWFSCLNGVCLLSACCTRCAAGAPATSLKAAAAQLDSMKGTPKHRYEVMQTVNAADDGPAE